MKLVIKLESDFLERSNIKNNRKDFKLSFATQCHQDRQIYDMKTNLFPPENQVQRIISYYLTHV